LKDLQCVDIDHKMNYDIGIIGAGTAGAFAAYRLAEKYPSSKIILIDSGPPPGKRRGQCNGFMGCFPTGDGKLYKNDVDNVGEVVDGRRCRAASNWVMDLFNSVDDMKSVKDTLPSVALQKHFKSEGFEIKSNPHFQWKPDSVHKLSRIFSEAFEESKGIKYSFNNEVYRISKSKGTFTLNTQLGDITCSKIIFCVGRSGWRWSTKVFRELGICKGDNSFKIGARFEMSGQYMRDFNKSHLTLSKDDLTIGPFNWNGTVVPEGHNDHDGQTDLVLSNFRSNEDRWRTEKVSFSMLREFKSEDSGTHQADRLAKLAYLLSNDRVGKERVKFFIRGKSQLNLVPEYSWMKETFQYLDSIIPNLINRGYYHVPNIEALPAKISLSSSLESDVEGMFIAGESGGISGLVAAAIMGTVAAEAAIK
jgi:uncharacterized FAD-dependent dehydrogenase